MQNIRTLCLGAAVVCVSTTASADTVRWINPAGGAWSDTQNWDLGQIPDTDDTVSFDLGAAYTVQVDIAPLYHTLSVTEGAVVFDLASGHRMMNNPDGDPDFPTFDVRSNSLGETAVTVIGDMFAFDTKFPKVLVGAGGVGPARLTVQGDLSPGAVPEYTIGNGTLIPQGDFGGILSDSSFGPNGRLITSGFECWELATSVGFTVELSGQIQSEFGFYNSTFLASGGSTLWGEAAVNLDIHALGPIAVNCVGMQDSTLWLSNADGSHFQAGKFAFWNNEFIVRVDEADPATPPALESSTFFDNWMVQCVFRAAHGNYQPGVGEVIPLLYDTSGRGSETEPASFIDSDPQGGIVLRPRWAGSTLYAIARPEGACDADFNLDGQVNAFDLFAFINAYNAGSPRANITADFAINFFDIDGYLLLFAAGCP